MVQLAKRVSPPSGGNASSTCGQGLTLVHFSAQLEPFLTQNTPQTLPDAAYHILGVPSYPLAPPKQPLHSP